MKKILYIINGIRNTGPNRVLENMIHSIDKNRYEIYVLSFLDNTENCQLKKIDALATYIELKYKRKYEIIFKGPKDVKKIIDKISPDIVHTHGIFPDFAISRVKCNASKITTIHNNMFEDYVYEFGLVIGKILAKIHIRLLNKFDNIICCSKSIYDVLKKYNNKISYVRNGISEKAVTVQNFVEDKRKELGIPKNDKIFVYVGRLSRRKNVIQLIKKFNACLKNDEHLLIIGEGELYKKCKTYNNKNIHIIGYKENALEYMAVSNIYISNSLSEGFSISIIEALERKLLLFLYDIPSHREIFEIDKNYYLGELFNDYDFGLKLDNLRKNYNYVNNDYLLEFKNKYLSSEVMMSEYYKYYGGYLDAIFYTNVSLS